MSGMGYRDFFPFGNKSVIIKFKCDKCGHHVESEEIEIPSPNYMAEKSSDSYNGNEGSAVCEKCEKDFNIYVNAGYADGYVEVSDVDDDTIQVNEIADERELDYYLDAIIESVNFIEVFNKEIFNLKLLNEINLKVQDLQETLRRQIYSER